MIALAALAMSVLWGPAAQALSWVDKKLDERTCGSVIEAAAKQINPAADVRVRSCEIGVAIGINRDVCFVTMLRDGQRRTDGRSVDCAGLIRESRAK